MKEIRVSHGTRKLIMDYFNVTYPTVRKALRYNTNSVTALAIRAYALEHGGWLVRLERFE